MRLLATSTETDTPIYSSALLAMISAEWMQAVHIFIWVPLTSP